MVLPHRLRFQRPPRFCFANPQRKWLRREVTLLHGDELTARCIACLPHRNERVETEGFAPPECLGVGQVPSLLGYVSKMARSTGAAPAIPCSTGRCLC
jgi:hypothetical protein